MVKKQEERFSDDHMQALFGSKTRVRLLRLFLSTPDRAYYVRELTRLVDTQINAIRREITNLLSIGIIEQNIDKNGELELENLKSGRVIHKGIHGLDKKYYQVNKTYFLYPELRQLFGKMNGMSQDMLVENIKALGTITLLVLGGRFVNDSVGSVDLLVVGELDKDNVQVVIDDYVCNATYEINYTVLTDDEFLYRQEVMDRFLYGILQNPKNMFLIDKRRLRKL